MEVNALSDIVVIRRLPPEEMSAGGIVLAHDADFREDIGVVHSVGPGKVYGCKECGTQHRRPVDVEPGDKVIFSTHGHQITNYAGEEFVILREPSIIGVIEEKKDTHILRMEQPV